MTNKLDSSRGCLTTGPRYICTRNGTYENTQRHSFLVLSTRVDILGPFVETFGNQNVEILPNSIPCHPLSCLQVLAAVASQSNNSGQFLTDLQNSQFISVHVCRRVSFFVWRGMGKSKFLTNTLSDSEWTGRCAETHLAWTTSWSFTCLWYKMEGFPCITLSLS